MQSLVDEVRACNIDSLASGERIAKVVEWYENQHVKFRFWFSFFLFLMI